jgi:predicted Zn-dependent peptidase
VTRQGFSADEVDAAREHLHGALPLSLTSPRALLEYALRGWEAGLDLSALEADWQALRTVPLEAVNAAARRLIGDARFYLTIVGPARELLPQLGGLGEPAVLRFAAPPDKWPHPIADCGL